MRDNDWFFIIVMGCLATMLVLMLSFLELMIWRAAYAWWQKAPTLIMLLLMQGHIAALLYAIVLELRK